MRCFVSILKCPYPHESDCHNVSHTGHKFSEKNVGEEMQPYFEIPLSLFIHKIYEQNFCQYTNSLLSVDMDLQKCGQKSTCFFIEKQKKDKNGRKTDTV